jgi:hypothetical protein
LDKKARETEAESASFAVCQHFGVPCTAPAYLALHGVDSRDVVARLEGLVGTVQAVIRGVEANLTVLTQQVINQ